MSFAGMYVSVPCVWSAFGGQKRASDPLELKLQMVVRHYVGAGNWTLVHCKSSNCSWSVSCLFIQILHFYKYLL